VEYFLSPMFEYEDSLSLFPSYVALAVAETQLGSLFENMALCAVANIPLFFPPPNLFIFVLVNEFRRTPW